MYSAFRFFLTPYRGRFVVLGIVMLVASLLEGFTIAAFFPVFLAIIRPGGTDQLPGLLRAMVDAGQLLPWADPVLAASVLLALVLTGRTIVLFARDALIASTGGRVLYDLRQGLVEQYARLPYQFFTAQKEGTLLYQAIVAPSPVALMLQRIPQCA